MFRIQAALLTLFLGFSGSAFAAEVTSCDSGLATLARDEQVAMAFARKHLPWSFAGIGGYLATVVARNHGISNALTQHYSNFGLGFVAASTFEGLLLGTKVGARYPRLVRGITLGALATANIYYEYWHLVRPDYADLTTGLLAIPAYHAISSRFLSSARREAGLGVDPGSNQR